MRLRKPFEWEMMDKSYRELAKKYAPHLLLESGDYEIEGGICILRREDFINHNKQTNDREFFDALWCLYGGENAPLGHYNLKQRTIYLYDDGVGIYGGVYDMIEEKFLTCVDLCYSPYSPYGKYIYNKDEKNKMFSILSFDKK